MVAIEVEFTPKTNSELRANLRAYQQARRPVVYLGTAPVVRELQGRPAAGGRWIDGVAQDAGLLPPGEPAPDAGGLLRVRPLTIADPGVVRRIALHAGRYRRLDG